MAQQPENALMQSLGVNVCTRQNKAFYDQNLSKPNQK